MKRRILSLGLMMAFLCPPYAQARILYEVIDLGTFEGGGESIASSINNSGQIVGKAQVSPWGVWRACLFNPDGPIMDLGTLGGQGSVAGCINDYGIIVGTADIDYPWYPRANACRFVPGGENISLCPRSKLSGAMAINNYGETVGIYEAGAGVWACRFIPYYPYAQGFGSLGGDDSRAESINDNGQVVGAAVTGSSDTRACLFDTDTTPPRINIDLGTLGGLGSHARSINNSGEIVGFADTASGWMHACLFDPTGGWDNTDLGTLGGDESRALSINDAAQIVGWADKTAGSWSRRATLFDRTGGGNNFDLNDAIDPGSGWTLWHAHSINDNGWIVGSGANPAGSQRAYLLVPRPVIEATVDIQPDTLNLQSRLPSITCHVELPAGYDVGDIDVGTIVLEAHVPAQSHPTELGDYDGDTIGDLMVKFPASAVRTLLLELGLLGDVALTVSGELIDGTLFDGTDVIKVIDKGKS